MSNEKRILATDYDDLVASKLQTALPKGFKPKKLNKHLFDWQAAVVELACIKGRFALFEDCGLGKTRQQQARELASRASEADCSVRFSAPQMFFDRDTCSWKTAQCSFLGDSTLSSQDWPRAGTMRDGQCWPQLTWVRPISANAGGVSVGDPIWPTPTASDAEQAGSAKAQHQTLHRVITNQLRFHTPRANDAEKRGKIDTTNPRNGLAGQAQHQATGGQLNPAWVEWLMGWRIGHTACAAWVTAKSRSARRRRGSCSADPSNHQSLI